MGKKQNKVPKIHLGTLYRTHIDGIFQEFQEFQDRLNFFNSNLAHPTCPTPTSPHFPFFIFHSSSSPLPHLTQSNNHPHKQQSIPTFPSQRSAHTTPTIPTHLACPANPKPETDPTDAIGIGIGIATAHASKSAPAAETETGTVNTSAAATKTSTKAQHPVLETRARPSTASAGNRGTSRTRIMSGMSMMRSGSGVGNGGADGGRRMKLRGLFMGTRGDGIERGRGGVRG